MVDTKGRFEKGNIPWITGRQHTATTKAKISEKKKGEKHQNYGKQLPEETRHKISVKLKGRDKSEEARKHMSEGHIGTCHSEVVKRKISEAHKGVKHWSYGKKRPEGVRRKISEGHRGQLAWNKGKTGIYSDETRRKMAEAHKGEKNPNWNSGSSFGSYCPKFNEKFKESIREKFGRMCFLCSRTEEENGRRLSVHHVNYNKDCLCGNSKCEFVPLCASCHARTNTKHEYYKNEILGKLEEPPWLMMNG